jgi:hypothetical protein
MTEPIKVQIIENQNRIDWNVWFLLIAVLTLIAAVLIPFLQKKYEERKSKYGFHLYVKKRLGIVWNLLTYDNFEYKEFKDKDTLESLVMTFDKLIYHYENDYNRNKNTIHPLFAFGIILNFQNMLFTIYRIQNALQEVDISHLEEKTLEFGDKLSKKEHLKLTGLFLLIQHYRSITSFHDKFWSLKSIKREIKSSKWSGLIVEQKVLDNQKMILDDLAYMRENEISINEIINVNKLLIQELKSYFEYNKLLKSKKK